MGEQPQRGSGWVWPTLWEALLALDSGEQGGQHGLDLHGGAGAYHGLALFL